MYDTGDPVKCASIVLQMADMEKPPMRLPLTTFSYDVSKQVLQERLAELETWKEYSFMADISAG